MILLRAILLIITLAPATLMAKPYEQLVQKYARQYQVDAALVHAVIKQESNYNTLAESHAGAQGLMQLMPATADRFGVKNSFIPEQNIKAGTKYLAWLLKRFNGNVRFALAGYNAGEGKVDRYKGIPPYRETQNYVIKVMAHYKALKSAHKTIQRKPQQPRIARTNRTTRIHGSANRVHAVSYRKPHSGYTRISTQTGRQL